MSIFSSITIANTLKRLLVVFANSVGLVSIMSFADPATDDIVVIAHPSVSQSSMQVSNVRSIFGMRSRNWPTGSSIDVFVLPDDHPTHVKFTKDILQTFPYNLRRIWDRRVFSGVGQAPTSLSSEEEMINHIANSKGAIGYVHRSLIDDDRVVVLELGR